MRQPLSPQRKSTQSAAKSSRARQTPLQRQPENAPSDPLVQLAQAEYGHSLTKGTFTIQPALVVGEPGDKYEQEADAIASQAVQMSSDEDKTAVQQKEDGSRAESTAQRQSAESSNQAMPVQQKMATADVQRAPDMEMGNAMLGMGGGGGMPDMAGAGDLAGGSLGEMGDALGGSDLGGMAEAVSGGTGDAGDAGTGMMAVLGGGSASEGEGGVTDALGMAAESGALDEVAPEMADSLAAGGATAGELPEPTLLPGGEMLGGEGGEADGLEAMIVAAMNAGGQPLPADTQALLRRQLGMANPDEIVIHTDSRAAELCEAMGALAFTTGNHIFFAEGEFDPDSAAGQELLFHEAVHTMQQGAIAPANETGEAAVSDIEEEPLPAETGGEMTSGGTGANGGLTGAEIATETQSEIDSEVAPGVEAVTGAGEEAQITSETSPATGASDDTESSGQTEAEQEEAAKEEQAETEAKGQEEEENAKEEGATATGEAVEAAEKLDTGGSAGTAKQGFAVPKVGDYTGGIDEITYDEFDIEEVDEPEYEPDYEPDAEGEPLPTFDELASGTVQFSLEQANTELNWLTSEEPEEEAPDDYITEDDDQVFSTADRGE
ncbi:MAG: DUF4157 domain-containing protein [Spirulinaceae cyanobacterium SM2_1_0]|nr:DUF4157 domain-containing protein [Spirulinaceae cyanobacterium SM2_1_0]